MLILEALRYSNSEYSKEGRLLCVALNTVDTLSSEVKCSVTVRVVLSPMLVHTLVAV